MLEVAANVSSAEELTAVFQDGADGIGLFRTEMLFLGRTTAPSEEEQVEVYAQAARAAVSKPVILRTFDVGGDKPLPYLHMPAEGNPFLGYRGVRVYADHQELLEAQLRAILRASALGRIQLMVPMVSALDEVLWMKARIAKVQEDLRSRRIAFDPAMPVGMMIEVPSVAFILEQLCRELDFFSIGTNDLSQYFLAVDRDNSRVAGLSNVRHPGFLNFLEHIVSGVHRHGKWVGMCGDMAADLRHLPLLVALGLDEISVPAAEIPIVKERIARLAVPDCRKLLAQSLACQRASDVEACLDRENNGAGRSLLDRELVLLDGEIDSKEEAIREIVDAFYVQGRTDDPDRLEEAVWTRESVYSTGLGHGFAVPHCKTDAVNAGSIGILKLRRPVDWGAVDGKPVQFVILLAARESDGNGAHLRVFSRLARNLMSEEFRGQLLNAQDREDVLSRLNQEFEAPG
jgi:fructose-specific PTS system IIA-like component